MPMTISAHKLKYLYFSTFYITKKILDTKQPTNYNTHKSSTIMEKI